jgi:hypothetical protein
MIGLAKINTITPIAPIQPTAQRVAMCVAAAPSAIRRAPRLCPTKVVAVTCEGRRPSHGPTLTQAALLPVAYFTGASFRPAKRTPTVERTFWNTWGP